MEATPAPAAPILLYIVGPPAAGKMTVGRHVAARTGLRLFHNHMSIELVVRFFDYGTEPYHRLVGEFRQRILQEAAASDLPGIIFTYVWDYDEPGDRQALERYAGPFRDRGGRVLTVELEADQEERLRRNEGASRLAEKPSKRNLESSRRSLLAMDAKYRMNSGGQFDGPDYLRVENTALAPDEVATRVIDFFGLG